MNKTEQIYGLELKIQRSFKNLENSNLSSHNLDLLEEFKNHLLAEGLSTSRITNYLSTFKVIAPLIDFKLDEASKKDLKRLVGEINQNKVPGEDRSVWTIAEYKKGVKKFYRFLEGEEEPDIIDFVKSHPKESEKPMTDPDELLKPEHVDEMVRNATNVRDKAYLKFLWDSGARIGEILSLDWGDLQFTDDMLRVSINNSKTGGRKVYLVECRERMLEWKKFYEDKLEDESVSRDDPVFITLRPFQEKRRMKYRTARKQIKKIRKDTGIPEHIKLNPHAWRKARATNMASKGMNQPTMNQYFGWAPGSDNPVLYIRLAKRDVEKSVRRIYGLEDQEPA
jgi:integrase